MYQDLQNGTKALNKTIHTCPTTHEVRAQSFRTGKYDSTRLALALVTVWHCPFQSSPLRRAHRAQLSRTARSISVARIL
jgi:hypothetical protein